MDTNWTMYISENQQMVQTAILSLVFILLFLAVIQLGLLRRRVKGICKSIKKYFDIILLEEDGKIQGVEEAATIEAATIEAAEVKEIVRREKREDANHLAEKNMRKQQEDAKLLMDVIQEVF